MHQQLMHRHLSLNGAESPVFIEYIQTLQLWDKFCYWIRELKFTLLVQLHRRDGRNGFCHGVNAEKVVQLHWRTLVNTAITNGLEIDNLAIAHHQIDHAWYTSLCHVL